MTFHPVGKLEDIPEGQSKVYQVENQDIAVCNVSGKLYAIEDVCTHDGASFDQGALDGCEIECPRHGARFDVTSGQPTELPAVIPVNVYEIRINGEIIEINI